MKCPHCQADNPEEATFCIKCGQKILEDIPLKCPECGTELPEGAIFCYKCGQSLTGGIPSSTTKESSAPPITEPTSFVDGRYEGKIHLLTARGDMFPLSPQTRIALSPDSEMVKSRSRHHIRDAGMAGTFRKFAALIEAAEKNPAAASIVYRGLVKRPEYPNPLEAMEVTI